MVPREETILIPIPRQESGGSQADSIRAPFEKLVGIWRAETQYKSSSTEIAMHPAYQRIIGLGPKVIPLIVEEWRERGGPWHWALRSITGVDPVNPADRGRMNVMRDAWLRWAEENGYKR